MTETVESPGELTGTPAPTGPRKNVLTDLDYAVLPGIGIAREVSAEVLAEADIAMDDILFARYLLSMPLARAVAAMAEAAGRRIEVAATVETMVSRMLERLADAELKPREGVAEALRTLLDNKLRLVFLTRLPQEAAAAVIERLELGATDTIITIERFDRLASFGIEAWKRVLHRFGLNERRSLALSAAAYSCRSAMMADLKVVALPDSLNDFADYSGVDARLSSTETLAAIIAERLGCEIAE